MTYDDQAYRGEVPPNNNGSYQWGNEPGAIQDAINRVMRMQEPQPFMEQFYAGTGLSGGQIGDYINKMFSGAGAARKAGEFEASGISDVNRIASQMFSRERQRSAATGKRGSSAEAALKARGGESLATARSGVRSQAASLEEQLRQAMFGRGMGALGAWEGATRGDQAAVNQYGELMLGATNPLLGVTSLQFQQYLADIKYRMEQDRLAVEYPEQED